MPKKKEQPFHGFRASFHHPDGPPGYQICILNFGREAGIMNADGDIICTWPVIQRPRQVEVHQPPVKEKRRKEARMK